MNKVWWMGVGLGAAALLSACGDGETTTTSSVLTIDATNYDTLPPTQSTLPPTSVVTTLPTDPGTTTPPGGVTTEITEYTIKDGDYEGKVAGRFKISLDQLRLANADTANYSMFYVGLKIKIPAGATIPTEADPPEDTTPAGETTTTVSICAQGSYVIESGDLPSTVAKKFDVTKEQLDAANVNTKGYTNFVVGVKIIIPASNAESC